MATRIQNFEKQGKPGSESGARGRVHSKSDVDESESRRYVRAGRGTRPLVSVQIGEDRGKGRGESERERGGEKEREKEKEDEQKKKREDEQRKKREEEMRRLRREEDRLQRERREREKQPTGPIKQSSLLSDYENVDLGPSSPVKSKHSKAKDTKTSPPEPRRRDGAKDVKRGPRDHTMDYENVAIHYTRSNSRSPESPKVASGQPSRGGGKRGKETKEKGGVASGKKRAPRTRHQYENITILTESGPMPYLSDSDEEVEDFSGDESPAPEEVIYENFGSDKGNQYMSAEEMEKHLQQKGKKGMSVEYLRIKNEPLAHPYTACK